MGLLDRWRKPAADAPPASPTAPVSKRKTGERVVCACGQSFATSDEHHRHLHDAHPEHHH
jgi:hypothetical protein